MARTRFVAALVAVALGILWTPAIGQTQTPTERLEITAFAVNMSNIATGANAVVDIRVNAWSDQKEREGLITTMLEKGPDDLLRALTRTPVKGRFRIPGLMGPDPHQLRLGHDIHYAWQVALPDGGRQIVLATDRYIGFQEARNQPRSTDYPFTLIQIHVKPNGEGEGKMAVATKIFFDKKQNAMVLENYGTEPVRLNALKVKTVS